MHIVWNYTLQILYQALLVLGGLELIGLFMIDSNNWLSVFPGSILCKRVLYTNLVSATKKETPDTVVSYNTETLCDKIKWWAMSHITKTHISHHWWYDKLPTDIRTSFDYLSNSKAISHMFSQIFHPNVYVIEPIHEMNEIYVTGNERKDEPIQSDRVFFISHIDGPFMWMPFVSVYRCLIGINDNTRITTHFPLAQLDYKIQKGDVLGFDFNREIHYISETTSDSEPEPEPRVTLKSHYCIYPKWAYWIGKGMYWCNARYNQLFRYLFLKTIQPESWIDRINGFGVVASTHMFVWLETYIGYRNLYFIAFAYAWCQGNMTDMTMALYTTCVYKYMALLFVSNKWKTIEKWSTLRDIGFYYLVALFCMFYYRVIL